MTGLPSTLPTAARGAAALLVGLLCLGLAPAHAISGVCPDGSIFIVQDASAIPCRNAKRVEPDEIPPLSPEFLPRPYGWEVFNREQDPNNPYNLVDADRPGMDADARAPAPIASTPAPAPIASTPAPVAPPVSASPPLGAAAPAPFTLGLSETEIEDLVAIIAVLQRRAPATIVQRDADPQRGLTVRFARSAAFEARLADALAARAGSPDGPVVVFHVQADAPGAFWGNLTFVQGHVAYSPDKTDPAQFGLVDGRLGPQPEGSRVVGYAVLPPRADPAQPLDVYWNDRRLTAVLSP